MKFMKLIVLFSIAVMLTCCTGVKNRRLVCSGLLQVGISSDAFKQVWGLPTRTKILSGDEIVTAGWGGGGGSFYKGKSYFQVWVYEDRGVELAFSTKDRNLVGWDTKKSVQELAAEDQEACMKERKVK